MAAARPIVAVDCAAHRAVLDDDSALLVSANPAMLGAAIVRLLRDPALAERLAAHAAGRAEREFTWSAFVVQVGRLHAGFAAAAVDAGGVSRRRRSGLGITY
jgi:glycosyltransferase involved in cell wall biosynthesis